MKLLNSPLVSIVIPCYNHESFVQDCIQSVIDQTYENIELIIIDDGSKDKSIEKIQEMIPVCTERFTNFEFRYRANKGLSTTLNEALIWCQGKYFSPIASDDIMEKNKTLKQVEILENNNELLGVFGKVYILGDNGEILETQGLTAKEIIFEDLFLNGEYLFAATQMLNLKSVKDIGFRNGFILEDWYIYLKMLENGGKFRQINDVFAFYRQHENNTSKSFYKMILGRVQVLNEFLHHPRIDEKFIRLAFIIILKNLKSNTNLVLNILLKILIEKVKSIFKFISLR